MRVIAVLLVILWLAACSTATRNEHFPRFTFDLMDKGAKEIAVYSVESEKYHLERMSGAGLSGLYLIKETHLSSFTGGIEGNRGEISLELMEIDQNTGRTSDPIWSISESAQDWQFKDGYIVFVNVDIVLGQRLQLHAMLY